MSDVYQKKYALNNDQLPDFEALKEIRRTQGSYEMGKVEKIYWQKTDAVAARFKQQYLAGTSLTMDVHSALYTFWVTGKDQAELQNLPDQAENCHLEFAGPGSSIHDNRLG